MRAAWLVTAMGYYFFFFFFDIVLKASYGGGSWLDSRPSRIRVRVIGVGQTGLLHCPIV
jgi:hypothetical protein